MDIGNTTGSAISGCYPMRPKGMTHRQRPGGPKTSAIPAHFLQATGVPLRAKPLSSGSPDRRGLMVDFRESRTGWVPIAQESGEAGYCSYRGHQSGAQSWYWLLVRLVNLLPSAFIT